MSENAALFCRVLPADLLFMDRLARLEMRSRNNHVAMALHRVVSGQKEAPSEFPEAVSASDSVVLFCRLPTELKHACAARAAAAGIPLSRWVRAVLTAP